MNSIKLIDINILEKVFLDESHDGKIRKIAIDVIDKRSSYKFLKTISNLHLLSDLGKHIYIYISDEKYKKLKLFQYLSFLSFFIGVALFVIATQSYFPNSVLVFLSVFLACSPPFLYWAKKEDLIPIKIFKTNNGFVVESTDDIIERIKRNQNKKVD